MIGTLDHGCFERNTPSTLIKDQTHSKSWKIQMHDWNFTIFPKT